MKYPLHVIIRKKISEQINSFLALFKKKSTFKTTLHKEDIKTIVLIRPNYRIGNILFLTPLINELHKHLPKAKIDIIVGMKLAGNILEPMPNVNKIIDIPRKLLLQPLDLLRYIKESRKKKYDLAINVAGSSTSAQIVMTLMRAQYKASFASKKLWTHFTHIQKRGEKRFSHMGLESLEFLRFFDIELPKQAPSLDIKLTEQEIDSAKNKLNKLLKENHITREDHKIVALFRNARFDKKIQDEWWRELIEAMKKENSSFIFVDILSPDIPTKLDDNLLEYATKDLRELGAFFRVCNLFISADTGPLHLAVASQAKIAALFTKTEIPIYGALGEKNKNIDINNLSPQEVAKKITS